MHIGLSNINGKMGLALKNVIAKHNDLTLQIGLSRRTVANNIPPMTSNIAELFNSTDVIIDFSTPEITEQIITESQKHNIPLVIGTTGLEEKQYNLIDKFSNHVPILCDQNTSLGITMLNTILPTLVSNLLEYDIDVCDKHHRYKVDSPSGTARKLIQTIFDNNSTLSKNLYTATQARSRPDKSVGINVTRSGNIFGHHEISFTSDSESIKLSHTAFNRNLFASGALKAARWLINQKPGLYSMQDVFSL